MFYGYIPGPNTLGIGVDNFALQLPYTNPMWSIYGPRYNVQRDLAPLTGGYQKLAQDLPNVDLRADGVYLSGQIALQALSDFNNQNKGNT
jgi:hypothetical protein